MKRIVNTSELITVGRRGKMADQSSARIYGPEKSLIYKYAKLA